MPGGAWRPRAGH